MKTVLEILIASAVCAAVLGLIAVSRKGLLTPVREPGGLWIVIRPEGSGEKLEQTVRGAVLLRERGLADADVIIETDRLNSEGLRAACILERKYERVSLRSGGRSGDKKWNQETNS